DIRQRRQLAWCWRRGWRWRRRRRRRDGCGRGGARAALDGPRDRLSDRIGISVRVFIVVWRFILLRAALVYIRYMPRDPSPRELTSQCLASRTTQEEVHRIWQKAIGIVRRVDNRRQRSGDRS